MFSLFIELHLSIYFFGILGHLGKMLVILRDGRKLHGVLRSYDQFGKLFFFQPGF